MAKRPHTTQLELKNAARMAWNRRGLAADRLCLLVSDAENSVSEEVVSPSFGGLRSFPVDQFRGYHCDALIADIGRHSCDQHTLNIVLTLEAKRAMDAVVRRMFHLIVHDRTCSGSCAASASSAGTKAGASAIPHSVDGADFPRACRACIMSRYVADGRRPLAFQLVTC